MKVGKIILALVLAVCTTYTLTAQEDWPKIIEDDDLKVTVYQPQLDSLVGDLLYGMAAVSYARNGGQPSFGAMWFAATINTDRSTRLSSVSSVNVYEIRFPEDAGVNVDMESASTFFSREIPEWRLEFSLEDIVTSLEVKQRAEDPNFNDQAPEFIYRTEPTALIIIDGDPKWETIDNGVERVVNTPALIFRYSSDYYIIGNGKWYTSKTLTDWKYIEEPPKTLSKTVGKMLSDDAKKELLAEATDITVDIEIRTSPAELIQTSGEADLLPITGTNLLYVTNSESDILLDITRQQYYLLISGRWFVAKDLNGPWSYLPATDLPEDFAKIPEGNGKDGVLANVPGTDANKEALMDAQVPQTASIDRSTATTEVNYDGKPQFETIEETSLSYAKNSNKQVLRDGNRYYCVDDGIWYESESPDGPWFACTVRPPDVDKIPASYPVHNVKYVYIYDYTPNYVYCGYLPGYTGCYIYHGVPVYGTGWYYRPWYGRYYYPRPYTWGFSMSYNPWYGFSMGMHYSIGGPYFNFSIHFGSSGYRGPYGGYYGGYFGCRNWRPPYHPPYGGWYGPRGPSININNPTININNNRNVINNINRNNNYGNMYTNRSWGGNEKLGNRPSTRQATRPGVAHTGTRPATKDARRPVAARPAPGAPKRDATRPATSPSTRPSTGGVSPSIDRTKPADNTRPAARPETRPSTRPEAPTTRPSTQPSKVPPKKTPRTPNTSTRDIYSDPKGQTYQRNDKSWQPTGPTTRPSTQPGTYNGRNLNKDSYSRQRSSSRSSNYSSRPATRPTPRGGRGRG